MTLMEAYLWIALGSIPLGYYESSLVADDVKKERPNATRGQLIVGNIVIGSILAFSWPISLPLIAFSQLTRGNSE